MAPSSPPSSSRIFRRGETIFKAGDPANQIYLIESGLAAVSVLRGGKSFEIFQVGLNQILGEEVLWGAKVWTTNAIANNDVRAMPIPLEQVQALFAQAPELMKICTRSVIEKHRASTRTLQELKTEDDPTPCSMDRITKLFSVIHHVAQYTGTRKADAQVVVWPSFKKYCQRIFLESPVRLEQAVYILVKCGHARLEMIPCETDPEAPDELGFVHFTSLEHVREFAEFYRAYYFSPSKSAAPKTTEANLAILKEIETWNQCGKVHLPGVTDLEAA